MKAYMNSIVAILLSLSLLAGCGGAGPKETKDPFPPDETGIPAATASPNPTALPTLSPVVTPEPTSAPKPLSKGVEKLLKENLVVWKERDRRAWMAGRLVVPSAGIDVALFTWGEGPNEDEMRQLVTDAEDSAMFYSDGLGYVIADHSNQEFRTLSTVKKGDVGYIVCGESVITLVCDLAVDGINTGQGITDLEGFPVTADEDFTCYTCGEDWTKIKIVGWAVAEEDLFELVEKDDMLSYKNPEYNRIVAAIAAEESAAQRRAETEVAAGGDYYQ